MANELLEYTMDKDIHRKRNAIWFATGEKFRPYKGGFVSRRKAIARFFNEPPEPTVILGEGMTIRFWTEEPLKLLFPTLAISSIHGDNRWAWAEPIDLKSTKTMWRRYKT